MICTECGDVIKFDEDVTVSVVFRDGHVEKRCHHNPFNENDPMIVAILGSQDCYQRWVQTQAALN